MPPHIVPMCRHSPGCFVSRFFPANCVAICLHHGIVYSLTPDSGGPVQDSVCGSALPFYLLCRRLVSAWVAGVSAPPRACAFPTSVPCPYSLIVSYASLALQSSDGPGDNHCDKNHRSLKKYLKLLLSSASYQGEPARLDGALKFIKVFAPGGCKVDS